MIISSLIYRFHKNFFKRSSNGRNNKKNKLKLSTEFTMAKGQNLKSTVFGFQQDAMIASYCPNKKTCSQYVVNNV